MASFNREQLIKASRLFQVIARDLAPNPKAVAHCKEVFARFARELEAEAKALEVDTRGHDFRREPGVELPVTVLLGWVSSARASGATFIADRIENYATGNYRAGWSFRCRACGADDPHTKEPCPKRTEFSTAETPSGVA